MYLFFIKIKITETKLNVERNRVLKSNKFKILFFIKKSYQNLLVITLILILIKK